MSFPSSRAIPFGEGVGVELYSLSRFQAFRLILTFLAKGTTQTPRGIRRKVLSVFELLDFSLPSMPAGDDLGTRFLPLLF